MLWVHASNAARFEQSFRDIADRVKIPGRRDPVVNILQLVHEWLCDERRGEWVLILDNVDDAGFLIETRPSAAQDVQTSGTSYGKSRRPIDYLPHCSHGRILVTTRSRDAALEFMEQQRDFITLGPMDNQEALALLNRKLKGHMDQLTSTELITALECIPLAIVQAAAYIFQRLPRYSVQQFIEDFRKNDRKRSSLLNHAGERLRRDREAKNSIIITWQISFDHIRDTRPSAADLLSLMSFFDRQGIPETLLRSNEDLLDTRQDPNKIIDGKRAHLTSDDDDGDHDSDSTDNDSPSSVSDEDFAQDVITLRNYSFISNNSHGTVFEMHALVQLAMREWLKAHKQQERWKEQFLTKP